MSSVASRVEQFTGVLVSSSESAPDALITVLRWRAIGSMLTLRVLAVKELLLQVSRTTACR